MIKRSLAVLATCLLLGGCSAKSKIDGAAVDIGITAQSSQSLFAEIGVLAESSEARFVTAGDSDGATEQQEIQSAASVGVDEQDSIIDAASGIRTSLHGVEDVIPWWATLVGRAAIAAAVVAVLIFLWRSGLLSLIRSFVWSLGLLIPKRSKREVELDLKAMSPESPVTLRESVAAKRASDPAYAAAYENAKRNKT